MIIHRIVFRHENRNHNPDKGTETKEDGKMATNSYMIRNDNPDKGTETNNR